jgi:GWxTD domain-containing protein
MPRLALIFLSALVTPVVGWGQKGLLNTSVFLEGKDLHPVVQAVWQIEPQALHYRRAGDSLISAMFKTEVSIVADTGILFRETWLTRTPAAVPDRAQELLLLDTWKHPISTGKYRLRVRIEEAGFESLSFVMENSFTVVRPSLFPAVSEPQLLDTFYNRGTGTGAFVRGNWKVVPLSTDYLEDRKRVLNYYVESYTADSGSSAANSEVMLRVGIVRKGIGGLIAQKTDTIAVGRLKAVNSYVGSIPIGGLGSGNYLLQVSLEDKTGRRIAASERAFQRSNAAPDEAPAAPSDTAKQSKEIFVDISKTFAGRLKEQQLPAALRMILPIATPLEEAGIQTLLRAPDPQYSRSILYQFFAQRNPANPDEGWNAYADRVRAVNRAYHRGMLAGYETERGKIELRFGPPDERITVPVEAGSRPYEVWIYHVLKSNGRPVNFLFYQPAGQLDDYVLLHSTDPDGLRNPQWRYYLYPGGNNVRAQAEQYFPLH